MSTVILQNPATYESRTVRGAAMVMDGVEVISCSLDRLREHATLLRGGAMPVGTVEFVRYAMKIAGVEEPSNLSYPEQVRDLLHRTVKRKRVADVDSECFVKPARTKYFTGFVFRPHQPAHEQTAQEREQLDAFLRMPPDGAVWVSQPVEWQCEYRYYVAHGKVVGSARYDESGFYNAPEPDAAVVQNCIQRVNMDHPYALDMGVLSTGETALVEFNDAWSIGLYENALSARDYYAFLRARWDSLLGQRELMLEECGVH